MFLAVLLHFIGISYDFSEISMVLRFISFVIVEAMPNRWALEATFEAQEKSSQNLFLKSNIENMYRKCKKMQNDIIYIPYYKVLFSIINLIPLILMFHSDAS